MNWNNVKIPKSISRQFIAGNVNQEWGWLNKFSIDHNRSKNPKTSMPTAGEATREPYTLQKDSQTEKTLALKDPAIIIPTQATQRLDILSH